ncbi:AFG3-like protein 2 isoform X2 [Neocloeon triangulifer]|nr:AFG3-like protein 2 isoform X2 [Neocloeon triangulifer]
MSSISVAHKKETRLIDIYNYATDIINLAPSVLCWIVVLLILIAAVFGINLSIMSDEPVSTNIHLINQPSHSINFSDIVGCDEAKLEIMEIVNFLKHPEIYTDMGAKIPRGALLHGPPGTGKTALAKAAAAEANVAFITMSGPEFNEIFVGVGPRRVRQLFDLAKRNAPSIIFIDEIDSIANKRSALSGGSEQDSTLNQMLVEMDGFEALEKVIVMAATNRLEILDPALLRAGRFDRLVRVPAPDEKDRAALFEKYLRSVNVLGTLRKSELANELAKITPGFTGATIAGVCNEAAILATRNGQCSVEQHNFIEAIDRVLTGSGGQTHLTPEEMFAVAHHEAGHVVTAWFLKHSDPLLKVTITPRGNALGFTQFSPKDLKLQTKEQIFDRMCVLLGGRVAEELFFGKISTGAADDLRVATNIAYEMVMSLGMSDKIGAMSFQEREKYPLSEEFSKKIDSEVHQLLSKALETTTELLYLHKSDISLIAEKLIEKNTLQAEEIETLIGKRPFG